MSSQIIGIAQVLLPGSLRQPLAEIQAHQPLPLPASLQRNLLLLIPVETPTARVQIRIRVE